jgi:hypothetical protein
MYLLGNFLPIHISMKNMIHMAWSTHAISSHLTLAAWSPANILLVPVCRRQVPFVACPSPRRWRRPYQCMVHLSLFLSLSAINVHPITLNKSIVDRSMGQLLLKGQKLKICARTILPRGDPKSKSTSQLHQQCDPACNHHTYTSLEYTCNKFSLDSCSLESCKHTFGTCL